MFLVTVLGDLVAVPARAANDHPLDDPVPGTVQTAFGEKHRLARTESGTV